MSSGSFTPAKSAFSRVFLIEGRAGPTHAPSYESCLKAGPLSQGFGDVEPIKCPDPNRYGQFIEIGEIQGAEERPTTNLMGRYAADVASALLRLAKQRCDADVQIHFGACTDPRIFNSFTKAVVFEKARFTQYTTDDLGALEDGENAKVNETGELSAREVYEVLPLRLAKKADDLVTNQVVDVVICDSASCGGDCESESDGCEKIYAITLAAGGSPSTQADIVFSLDKGVTWYAHDIDSLGIAEDPSGVACLAEYVVVVSNDSCSLHYVLKSELDGVADPDWTEVTTGFVAAHCPNDIWTVNGRSWIVGDGGYVYYSDDPTAGVTVSDAGVATDQDLLCVHACDTYTIIAGSEHGHVIYSANGGDSWAMATNPVGVNVHITAIWAKSAKEWWIGTTAGRLYYTTDQGVTWTEKTFSGSGAGTIDDIAFSTDSVGYLAHATATPAGRILRTFDGGYSWTILPEGTGIIPANDQVTALAACPDDPNFVVGGGLADNATDGFLVIGQD